MDKKREKSRSKLPDHSWQPGRRRPAGPACGRFWATAPTFASSPAQPGRAGPAWRDFSQSTPDSARATVFPAWSRSGWTTFGTFGPSCPVRSSSPPISRNTPILCTYGFGHLLPIGLRDLSCDFYPSQFDAEFAPKSTLFNKIQQKSSKTNSFLSLPLAFGR